MGGQCEKWTEAERREFQRERGRPLDCRYEVEVTTRERADGAYEKCLKVTIPAGGGRERGELEEILDEMANDLRARAAPRQKWRCANCGDGWDELHACYNCGAPAEEMLEERSEPHRDDESENDDESDAPQPWACGNCGMGSDMRHVCYNCGAPASGMIKCQ